MENRLDKSVDRATFRPQSRTQQKLTSQMQLMPEVECRDMQFSFANVLQVVVVVVQRVCTAAEGNFKLCRRVVWFHVI